MMKQIYILAIALFFIEINTNAQTTDVVTGEFNTLDLEVKGNYLYFVNNYFTPYSTLNKINLAATESSVTIEPVAYLSLNGSSGLYPGLTIRGNDIYVAEYGYAYGYGRIHKINITNSSPIVSNVFVNIGHPLKLALHGNDLYSTSNASSGISISKINIKNSTPTITEVIDGIAAVSLAIHGNYLYFTHANGLGGLSLSKINLTQDEPTVVNILSGLYGAALDMEFHGNYLYFCDYENNKISKINITQETPSVTDVVTGLNGPIALAIHSNNLYIAELNKIYKFSLAPPSVNRNTTDNKTTIKEKISLFPNPSNDFIQVQGIQEPVNFVIYSSIGQKVTDGEISNNEKLDIQNLSNGLYFLNLENFETLKFVKQ